MLLTTPHLTLTIRLSPSPGQQNLMEVADTKVFKVTFDDQGRFAAYRADTDNPYVTSATSSAKAEGFAISYQTNVLKNELKTYSARGVQVTAIQYSLHGGGEQTSFMTQMGANANHAGSNTFDRTYLHMLGILAQVSESAPEKLIKYAEETPELATPAGGNPPSMFGIPASTTGAYGASSAAASGASGQFGSSASFGSGFGATAPSAFGRW